MSVMLDASALLAYLNQEAGAEEVAEQMVGGGFISAVNLAEVYIKVTEWGQDAHLLEQALVRQGLLGGLLEEVPFGLEDAQLAARLRPLESAKKPIVNHQELSVTTESRRPASENPSAFR